MAGTGGGRAAPHDEEGLEEELFELNLTSPESVETLPQMFRESVEGAIGSILERGESDALLVGLKRVNLGYRVDAFNAIDAVCGDEAPALKAAIDLEFQAKVRRLLNRAGPDSLDFWA